MKRMDLQVRTKRFAIEVIRMVRGLPTSDITSVLGRQLLRSGTSVGANYRSACRAKSLADFISKMKIVEEECDETSYWLELLVEGAVVPAIKLKALMQEANEILSLTVASIRTARERQKPQSSIRYSSFDIRHSNGGN